ncbi:protein DpdH [Microvirga aerophila]|uniref:Uncharacterized protein n=1 Tax=Microvirga aerophila TaxID=670291 RepID=A0A512BKW9_9HYPH|nr:protein DpdH [Microvirga aerophila]GEO12619.1 hypothetical protein MAE02_03150 [Microvirga aerophila]
MLESYWPEAQQVNACIKNEAETADVSVLLAVHQPSHLTTRNAGTNIENAANEQDLLDAFLSDNVPGGYLLVPITGPSGAGKSHIVRWLDAQLRRSPKREKLHIIRVPKSASLRRVVELILEPLAGDPRYAKPREALTRAVAEVDKRQAVVLFRAQLENALAIRFEQLSNEAREHKDRAPELRPLMGHAKSLPTLFSDAALAEHFVDKVLSRVVARALQGRSGENEGDETQSQFSGEDLILPDDVNLNDAAFAVRSYYQSQLAVSDTSRRQAAVDLLNSVVDTAIGNVFQLEQSTGGMTLQDIILGVREILFEDGKDLVLLVEDFAALAGIQDVLLKVCIQEGEYEGRKVRATMRTALALTDGYLVSRDTILTRAQRVWIVGNRQQTDNEIKSSVVDMVGAYLNAARWGAEGLRRRYDSWATSGLVTDWLPTWHDESQADDETAVLNAFGFSSRGSALFPFNRAAIDQMVQRHLTEGGRLVFNPRRVINEILRSTLLMRSAYLSGNFPPADLQGIRPNGFLAGWIRQASQPDAVKRRLGTLLAIWGGNAPDQAALSHLAPAIFTAFSLPTPGDLANIKYAPKPEKPTPAAAAASALTPDESIDGHPSSGVAPPPQDPRIAEWSARLDAWAAGAQLVQAEAREIRSVLAKMLESTINWASLRIPVQEIKPTWLSIANARSNPTGGRVLIVCDSHEDEDGTIREGLLGALRFGINDCRWAYPEADVDYCASAAIIDSLLRQLTPLLTEQAQTQTAVLGRALMIQARVAGLSPPLRLSGTDGLLRGLFAPVPVMGAQTFEENWDQLRGQVLGNINDQRARDLLQTLLLERVASFQGTGNKPFAIDTVRLLEALGADVPAAGPVPEGLPEHVRTFLPTISEVRIWARLQPVIAKLRAFKDEIGDFIDEKLDKTEFVNDLREIILMLQKTGTWPRGATMKVVEFDSRLTEFQSSPIVDLVGKTTTIVDEADREQIPKLLNALGSIDLGLIQRTMSFLHAADEILTLAEPRVVQEEASRKQADPGAIAGEIAGLFNILLDAGLVATEAAT